MNIEALKKKWYSEDQVDTDGALRRMIIESLDADSRVLDAGAGAGDLFPYDLKERVREMVGIDLDPRVESNPLLHRGIKADMTAIPVPDDYFDVVFCRYVLEHVTNPQPFINEIGRILRAGGRFIFLTPNKRHYVSIASRITPQRFHAWYNRLRGRKESDTFPTVYRLNTVTSIRSNLHAAGFVERKLDLLECCPNYLAFSFVTFILGVAYERIVNSTNCLAWARVNILGCFEKK